MQFLKTFDRAVFKILRITQLYLAIEHVVWTSASQRNSGAVRALHIYLHKSDCNFRI